MMGYWRGLLLLSGQGKGQKLMWVIVCRVSLLGRRREGSRSAQQSRSWNCVFPLQLTQGTDVGILSTNTLWILPILPTILPLLPGILILHLSLINPQQTEGVFAWRGAGLSPEFHGVGCNSTFHIPVIWGGIIPSAVGTILHLLLQVFFPSTINVVFWNDIWGVFCSFFSAATCLHWGTQGAESEEKNDLIKGECSTCNQPQIWTLRVSFKQFNFTSSST